MKKTNFLRKIIFESSYLMIPYIVVFMVYAWLSVWFSQLLGKSMDIASKTMGEFRTFAVTLIIVTLCMLLIYVLYTLIKNKCKKIIFYLARTKLYRAIQEKSIVEFSNEGYDYYISMLVNDTTMLESNYILPWLSTIEDVVTLIIAMVVLVTISPGSAIFVFIICCIPVILPSFFMSKLQNKMGTYANTNQGFFQKISDSMDGFETYKNYNSTGEIKRKFQESNIKLGKDKRDAYQYMDIMMSALGVASNLMLISILLFGMFMALNGKMTIGEVFAIMFISGSVVAPISNVAQNLPKLAGSKEIVEKYNKVMYKEVDERQEATFDQTISLDKVSVAFGERHVLQNINLSFEKEKKYALVGGSGSGKSTIIKAALGFYEHYEGNIQYDGTDLSTIKKASIFQQLTYVSQSTILFTGTIKENITMFDDRYSDEDVEEKLRMARLDQKVMELEEGINTSISEGGNNFSGGEKQRIAIARALLRGVKTFFMDEATSALDYTNFVEIEQLILGITGVTLVTVTHRLEQGILTQYDKIYVLREGDLIDEGTFEQLMNSCDYFKKLFQSQEIENK